jgi:peptide deformylase
MPGGISGKNSRAAGDGMEVYTLGSEYLRQKAEAVENIDGDVRRLCGDLFKAMKAGKGIGLAAPQVGLAKRLFVCHAEGDEERVFINPSITATSQEMVKMEEGCLSIPGVWAEVLRPEKITVQAWNEKGRRFVLEADGMLARVILHEYDHLEGVLFIDKLSELKRNRLISKYERRKPI